MDQSQLDYPALGQVVHLYLGEFCDESLTYHNMVAEAVRQASAEITRLRRIGGYPNFMIIGMFRYALGRTTYVVKDVTEWLIMHWGDISLEVQCLIQREVEEAFQSDDWSRQCETEARRGSLVRYRILHPLGEDCDRQAWDKLRQMWTINLAEFKERP